MDAVLCSVAELGTATEAALRSISTGILKTFFNSLIVLLKEGEEEDLLLVYIG